MGLEMNSMLQFKDSGDYHKAKAYALKNQNELGVVTPDDSDNTMHIYGNYGYEAPLHGPSSLPEHLKDSGKDTILNIIRSNTGISSGRMVSLNEYHDAEEDHSIPTYHISGNSVHYSRSTPDSKDYLVQKLALQMHPGDEEQELDEEEGVKPFWGTEAYHKGLMQSGMDKSAAVPFLTTALISGAASHIYDSKFHKNQVAKDTLAGLSGRQSIHKGAVGRLKGEAKNLAIGIAAPETRDMKNLGYEAGREMSNTKDLPVEVRHHLASNKAMASTEKWLKANKGKSFKDLYRSGTKDQRKLLHTMHKNPVLKAALSGMGSSHEEIRSIAQKAVGKVKDLPKGNYAPHGVKQKMLASGIVATVDPGEAASRVIMDSMDSKAFGKSKMGKQLGGWAVHKALPAIYSAGASEARGSKVMKAVNKTMVTGMKYGGMGGMGNQYEHVLNAGRKGLKVGHLAMGKHTVSTEDIRKGLKHVNLSHDTKRTIHGVLDKANHVDYNVPLKSRMKAIGKSLKGVIHEGILGDGRGKDLAKSVRDNAVKPAGKYLAAPVHKAQKINHALALISPHNTIKSKLSTANKLLGAVGGDNSVRGKIKTAFKMRSTQSKVRSLIGNVRKLRGMF